MHKILVVLPMFALAACGGGGGSSIPFVSISSLPANGTTTLSGKAVKANVSVDTFNRVTVNSVATDTAATASVTRNAGTNVAISAAANGSTATVDSRAGGTISGSGVITGADASNDTMFVVVDPSALSQNYQNYGFWFENGNSSTPSMSVGSFGTSAGSIPSSGTASYSGKSIGLYISSAREQFVTASDVNVSTDFTNVSVTSTGTNKVNAITSASSTASNLDFTSTSTVTGTSFAGTVTGGDVSGSINGEFYGPSGSEVGGVFSTAGTGGTYIGAFGAN